MTKGNRKSTNKKQAKRNWNPKQLEEIVIKYIAENFTLS